MLDNSIPNSTPQVNPFASNSSTSTNLSAEGDFHKVQQAIATQRNLLGADASRAGATGIWMSFELIDLCDGDFYEAGLLSLFHYWLQNNNNGKIHAGLRWIYKSVQDFRDNIFSCLSRDKIARVLRSLVRKNYLIREQLHFQVNNDYSWANRTYYYRINYQAIAEYVVSKGKNCFKPNNDADCANSHNQIVQERTMYITKNTFNKNAKKYNIEGSSKPRIEKPKLKPKKEPDKFNLENDYSEDISTNQEPVILSTHSQKEVQASQAADQPSLGQNSGGVTQSTSEVKQEMEKPVEIRQDKYFRQRNQLEEVKLRAKRHSALGMSDFQDLDDMRECQRQLVQYFVQRFNPETADLKASSIIKSEIRGQRSVYVQDYLDGKPIGDCIQKEWEIMPGLVAPVLIAYLRCKLRRNGDSHARSLERVKWELKDPAITAQHWAECKRLIDIQKPRLLKALEEGSDLVTQNIPEWIVEVYRPEVSVEAASETAEVLGEIATQYLERVTEVRQQYLPGESCEQDYFQEVPGSGLYRLKEAIGLPTQPIESLSEEEVPKVDPEQVMDRLVAENKKLHLASILPNLPEREMALTYSKIEIVDELLGDPITRELGLRKAKELDLPLIIDQYDQAIGVDVLGIKAETEKQSKGEEQVSYEPHKLYQPEKIEKVDKTAWEQAIARSPFLSRIREQKN